LGTTCRLDDAIRLRALGLGARMVDILERQVELIFVVLGVAAILAPLLASNDAQNGELGERERGSDYMAKAPKLNRIRAWAARWVVVIRPLSGKWQRTKH
jgi:hypothetical protein